MIFINYNWIIICLASVSILSSSRIIAEETRSSVLVEPLLSFTAKLFANAREDKKNTILSPISIHKSLNLILLSADVGSETQKEIEAALGYVNSSNANNDNTKFHQAHKDISKVFNDLNIDGREATKWLDANKPPSTRSSEHKEKPTMVDILSELVTKGECNLKPSYLNEARNYYGSSVERVQDGDPASKTKVIDKVNKWAKEAGFANNLMKPDELDCEFSVLALSTIRVEAFWFYSFEQMQGENIFYNHGLKDKLVKKGSVLFQRRPKNAGFLELSSKDRARQKHHYDGVVEKHGAALSSLVSLNARVVQVPMENDIKLTLFEPLDSGNGDELAKMLSQLLGGSEKTKLANVLKIIDDQEMSPMIEYLSLPEFKFESDIDIRAPLMALGIKRAFDSVQAELSNITSCPVYVNKVKHQAVIEVNKFGLKAAAITQVQWAKMKKWPIIEPITVKVENPFMFLVRYKNIPLFVGQLVEL